MESLVRIWTVSDSRGDCAQEAGMNNTEWNEMCCKEGHCIPWCGPSVDQILPLPGKSKERLCCTHTTVVWASHRMSETKGAGSELSISKNAPPI